MCVWDKWQVPALGQVFRPLLLKTRGVGGVEAKHACCSPRCPQNVMSVCVNLIHPLQAASFHRHAPHKHRLWAMLVGLFLLVVELKWGASTLSVSAETRERGQVCCGFKGRSGPAPATGWEASLVEDFGGSVRTSGLDDLLLWPCRLVLFCLALTHMDDHAGGGLCPCVELVLFTRS